MGVQQLRFLAAVAQNEGGDIEGVAFGVLAELAGGRVVAVAADIARAGVDRGHAGSKVMPRQRLHDVADPVGQPLRQPAIERRLGREADMVVLVLGTLPKSKKARDWVAATPNILNVAITRARHRFYVIGNRPSWSTHRYFDYLAKALPLDHGRDV